jgi:hypothetical protein
MFELVETSELTLQNSGRVWWSETDKEEYISYETRNL